MLEKFSKSIFFLSSWSECVVLKFFWKSKIAIQNNKSENSIYSSHEKEDNLVVFSKTRKIAPIVGFYARFNWNERSCYKLNQPLPQINEKFPKNFLFLRICQKYTKNSDVNTNFIFKKMKVWKKLIILKVEFKDEARNARSTIYINILFWHIYQKLPIFAQKGICLPGEGPVLPIDVSGELPESLVSLFNKWPGCGRWIPGDDMCRYVLVTNSSLDGAFYWFADGFTRSRDRW